MVVGELLPKTDAAMRRAERVIAACLLVLAGLGLVVAWPSTAFAASGERSGDVVIVDQGGAALSGGGSATAFQFRLPDGAACQGDTKHDDYRVQGFIIPASDDPTSLTWMEIKPEGDGRWGLYAEDTTPFTQLPTDVSEAGQPGPISGLPSVSFGVFPPGTLPDGSYRIGVSCTLNAQTTRYWDTGFEVQNTTSDSPAQFKWTVGGAPTDGKSRSPFLIIGLLVLVAGAAIALFVVVARTLRRRHPSSQEMT